MPGQNESSSGGDPGRWDLDVGAISERLRREGVVQLVAGVILALVGVIFARCNIVESMVFDEGARESTEDVLGEEVLSMRDVEYPVIAAAATALFSGSANPCPDSTGVTCGLQSNLHERARSLSDLIPSPPMPGVQTVDGWRPCIAWDPQWDMVCPVAPPMLRDCDSISRVQAEMRMERASMMRIRTKELWERHEAGFGDAQCADYGTGNGPDVLVPSRAASSGAAIGRMAAAAWVVRAIDTIVLRRGDGLDDSRGRGLVQAYFVSPDGVLGFWNLTTSGGRHPYVTLGPIKMWNEAMYLRRFIYGPTAGSREEYQSPVYIDYGGAGFVTTRCTPIYWQGGALAGVFCTDLPVESVLTPVPWLFRSEYVPDWIEETALRFLSPTRGARTSAPILVAAEVSVDVDGEGNVQRPVPVHPREVASLCHMIPDPQGGEDCLQGELGSEIRSVLGSGESSFSTVSALNIGSTEGNVHRSGYRLFVVPIGLVTKDRHRVLLVLGKNLEKPRGFLYLAFAAWIGGLLLVSSPLGQYGERVRMSGGDAIVRNLQVGVVGISRDLTITKGNDRAEEILRVGLPGFGVESVWRRRLVSLRDLSLAPSAVVAIEEGLDLRYEGLDFPSVEEGLREGTVLEFYLKIRTLGSRRVVAREHRWVRLRVTSLVSLGVAGGPASARFGVLTPVLRNDPLVASLDHALGMWGPGAARVDVPVAFLPAGDAERREGVES